MRKRIAGRRLKRDVNQRKALRRSLMNALVQYGRIKTTEAKAKTIKGEFEKLITRAKKDGEAARYHLQKDLQEASITKLITHIVPQYTNRPGGYTRIVRLGNRMKDNAPLVLLELVDYKQSFSANKQLVIEEPRKEKKTATKKAATAKTKKETKKTPPSRKATADKGGKK